MDVINVRKANLKKLGYSDLEDWLQDKNHLYIGRNMVFYVPGAIKSKWANPYPVKKYGLEICLKMYYEYILNSPELIESLPELKGKTLGCWCDSAEKCHGGILIKLLKDLQPE